MLLPFLKVMPLQTNSFFFFNKSATLTLKNLAFLNQLLRKKFIPVFCGDMIYDPQKQFRILSGDTISILLAKKLSALRVVFATDVDGVYSDEKKIGDRKFLLSSIFRKQLRAVLAGNKNFAARDTTGELPGKLREISSKPQKTKVFILNGLKAKNVYRGLAGKDIGTVIV